MINTIALYQTAILNLIEIKDLRSPNYPESNISQTNLRLVFAQDWRSHLQEKYPMLDLL